MRLHTSTHSGCKTDRYSPCPAYDLRQAARFLPLCLPLKANEGAAGGAPVAGWQDKNLRQGALIHHSAAYCQRHFLCSHIRPMCPPDTVLIFCFCWREVSGV